MNLLQKMWRRASVLMKERVDPDLDEELRFHLDETIQSNIRAGMSPADARSAALRRFGNVTLTKEDSRGVWLVPWIEAFFQDLHYGLRILRKNPGFTAVATLTLALGIGANTAIFSMVNAALLKPLPYPAPNELVTLRGGHSYPDIVDVARMVHSFVSLGAFADWPLDLIGRAEPERVDAALVGGDVFPALGTPAYLGRTFSDRDDAVHTPIVVVSYRFWQQKMASDPDAVGKSLTFSGQNYTVIGVMPPGFKFPQGLSEVWLPFAVGYPEAASARGAHFMFPVGRLREGVSKQQAQAELDAVGKKLGEMYPTEARTFIVQPLRDRMVRDTKAPLLVLLGAVGCVLLIACSNFASLLLARVATRTQEMKVRSALGAGRWRLVRQLVTESILLSLMGGALSVLLALAGVELLLRLKPEGITLFHAVSVDLPTLGFALALSLITGLVFGLAPAFQLLVDGHMDQGGARITGRSILRRALVVVELAAALVLLVGAGLLLRSFWELRNVDPGIQPEHVLTMRLTLPAKRYNSIPQQIAFLKRLDTSLHDVPSAEATGLITEMPFGGMHMVHNMAFHGRPMKPGDEPEIGTHEVSPGYFRAIGTPIVLGRGFTDLDREDSPLVGVVNQSMARQFWPNQSPMGAQVRWARSEGPPQWITIVGVAGNVRFEGLDQDEVPTIYTPFTQKLQIWKRWTAIVVRTRAPDPMQAATEVRKQVWQLDAQLPITHIKPMTLVIAESVSARRFNLTLLMMFAAVALSLAVIGIYGVISYLVTQRTREIGIRMALGAQRGNVLAMIVKQGLALTLVGVALGLAGALAASRVLKSLLFGVSITDPMTFVAVVALLALAALLASYIPARRATRIDPMAALRYE